MATPAPEVTQLLLDWGGGDEAARDQLIPLVHEELRRLARNHMRHERPGHSLQTSALVNEAYLRLVGGDAEQQWDSRGHFFAAAAEAMRRILVDNARRKRRPKHGGDRQRIDLEPASLLAPERADDLLALDEALSALAAEAPAKKPKAKKKDA